MKNDKTLIIGFCLCALAVSCSQSESEKIPENKNTEQALTTSVNKNDNNRRATIKEVEKSVEKPVLLGKRTIAFNGEKYIYEGEKLRKGSRVRNIHMSEYGTVKGTFVVVAKAGKTLDLAFKRKTKIAKDTYRLMPSKTDDLMTIYNELLLNDSIAIVELEIGYSSKKSGAAEY